MQSQIKIKEHSHILVMGVSGCGKSTIAKRLSAYFQRPFLEGDDFHPTENITKMSNGIPLNDEDRAPWLSAINEALKQHSKGTVLSCSALKNEYRLILQEGISNLLIVFLNGSFDLIYNRMRQRKDHFMPVELLESQFRTLEIPDDCIHVSIDQSVDDMVKEIINKIN